MKKFLSVMAAACCAMALNATIYTCHVKVTINGVISEQEQVQVEVNENNGAQRASTEYPRGGQQ